MHASPATALAKKVAKLPSGPIQFVEPMKCQLKPSLPKGEDWVYEIKFDGFRALALKDGDDTWLFSRNNKDLGGKFPGVLRALRKLPCDQLILDGEVVALDDRGRSSFQMLQRVGDAANQSAGLYYYAFDLLHLNGHDTTGLPLTGRKALLKSVLEGAPDTLRFSDTLTGSPEEITAAMQKLELEGLIAKKRDSTYEIGKRGGAWVKFKWSNEQEFVIGGYTRPEGSRPYFGAILVGYHAVSKPNVLRQPESAELSRADTPHPAEGRGAGARVAPGEPAALIFAGKVGTGFDAKLLKSLHDRFQEIRADATPFANLPERGGVITASQMRDCKWVRPELVCQVRFTEWTSDHHLRQPVFLGLREDKDPREVVREG
jgi:bifunctional non-homologous end joining protein LigD